MVMIFHGGLIHHRTDQKWIKCGCSTSLCLVKQPNNHWCFYLLQWTVTTTKTTQLANGVVYCFEPCCHNGRRAGKWHRSLYSISAVVVSHRWSGGILCAVTLSHVTKVVRHKVAGPDKAAQFLPSLSAPFMAQPRAVQGYNESLKDEKATKNTSKMDKFPSLFACQRIKRVLKFDCFFFLLLIVISYHCMRDGHLTDLTLLYTWQQKTLRRIRANKYVFQIFVWSLRSMICVYFNVYNNKQLFSKLQKCIVILKA